MKIQDTFGRDIRRSINGVVKADALEAAEVWQELDEFVVTQELGQHITRLVDVILSTIQSKPPSTDKNGIWVSGFFGCGKSHFIKVLSYLLENQQHEYEGNSRTAVDFFKDKIDDALLFADLTKVVAAQTDTILFNIDSKADHRDGRDALLAVFLKVLNEKQGYSGDHPHIAHMERYLDGKGKLEAFHSAFEKHAGASWLAERDGWEFRRDEVIAALAEVLGQSAESVEKWVDSGGENFSLTVENFAKWVKEYLDGKGGDQRIMFLVDEVGQFIGSDTHLMLNLQTITEKLGTVCGGRAWVVVTSQEDLDAVLGDLKSGKQHDFSKIQGRFKTRLSLSSNNVDEVIKKRLLAKNDNAESALAAAYDGKKDILKSQLSFTDAGMTFKSYADFDDFRDAYPFPAYQFALVQKVFESIRKAGATGLHVSKGERSTLDAFQNSAKQIGDQEIGLLVPFYRFYPSVEGFLDTTVKRTIAQAADNSSLESFDIEVLRVLFLIRYIDELPGSVDHLVTLCIDQIDGGTMSLRKKIEASLARLESETLIARNGGIYQFLTNEERDIGREIKNETLHSGAEEAALGRILFEELLGDLKKHTYKATGRDFSFARICDGHVLGNRPEDGLEVAFLSPLGDDYANLQEDGQCILQTSLEQSRVLVRLPDVPDAIRDLRIYLQTDSYIKKKSGSGVPETTKRILRDRNQDNLDRRKRIVGAMRAAVGDATWFANGATVPVNSSDPKEGLGTALNYLIQNTFSKMSYLGHLHPNPKHEIQTILRVDDVTTAGLGMEGTEGVDPNKQALDDLREYVRLCSQSSKQIRLDELVDGRYGGRPYGWPELEVVLLVARLAVLKEINLTGVDKKAIALDQAYDELVSPGKRKRVLISLRESADQGLTNAARNLGKDIFSAMGPDGEEPLFQFLQKNLQSWVNDLQQYKGIASTGNFPGKAEIENGLATSRKLVVESDSLRFLKAFSGAADELKDLAEDVQDLRQFYKSQRPTWDKLLATRTKLEPNRLQLEADEDAAQALERMKAIAEAPSPYGMLHEVEGLCTTALDVNDRLLSEARGPALAEIDKHLSLVDAELAKISAPDPLRTQATGPLAKLRSNAESAESIPHIAQARQSAEGACDTALAEIEGYSPPGPGGGDPPVVKSTPPTALQASDSAPQIIETADQADAFLSDLREKIIAAIDAGDRVRIK